MRGGLALLPAVAPAELLTKEEVSLYEQQSERWVERHAEELGVVDGPVGVNGRPEPLYDPARLSPAARERWLAGRKEAAEAARRKLEEAARAAADLTLSPRELERQTLELGEADRQVALARYRAIMPLLQAPEGERLKAAKQTAAAEGVAWRTLYRWLERFQGSYYEGRRGLEALADRARADRGQAKKLNDAARELIVALLTPDQRRGPLSMRQAHDEYEAERKLREALVGKIPDEFTARRLARWIDAEGRLSAEARLPRICRRTLQGWASQIPADFSELARMGPDAQDKRRLMVVSRDYASIAPLEVVVMDHRKLDVLCIVPGDGGRGARLDRPWMTAAMDMRTRRWLAWTVGSGANSDGIVSVIRQVVERFGRPQWMYWDNGQDFESKWLQALVEGMGMRVKHALPENARAKTIEPNFRRISTEERMLPEWLGHRPEIRPERIQQEARRWERGAADTIFRPLHEIAEIYQALLERLNERPLAGEGMLGQDQDGTWRPRTPLAVWSELAAGMTFEQVSQGDLLFLLRKPREATVRQGEISITYHGKAVRYRAEGDPLKLTKLEGKKVEVRYDPYDLRRVAVLVDGGLFWTMARTVDRRKFGEDDFQEDLAMRQRQARAVRERLAAVRTVGVVAPVDRLMGERRPPQPEPEVAKVTVALPEVRRAALAAGGGDATVRPVKVVRPDPGDGGGDDFDWRRMR